MGKVSRVIHATNAGRTLPVWRVRDTNRVRVATTMAPGASAAVRMAGTAAAGCIRAPVAVAAAGRAASASGR